MEFSAGTLDYPKRVIDIDRINTHSNRLGGACALKLAGYNAGVIRKMGRWVLGLEAFMEYIQQQLS